MSDYLTAKGQLSFEEFMDKLKQMLDIVWGKDWGTFSSEFPTGNEPEKHPLPHISYVLADKRIAKKHNPKGQTFDAIADPEHPGEKIIPTHTWFDLKIEFRIFHNTNREATELAERFSEFMRQYVGYFKEQGITEILFESECYKEPNDLYRQMLPFRSITYSAQFQQTSYKKTYLLKRVEAEIGVGPDAKSPVEKTNVVVAEEGDSKRGNNVVTHIEGGSFLDLYEKHFS